VMQTSRGGCCSEAVCWVVIWINSPQPPALLHGLGTTARTLNRPKGSNLMLYSGVSAVSSNRISPRPRLKQGFVCTVIKRRYMIQSKIIRQMSLFRGSTSRRQPSRVQNTTKSRCTRVWKVHHPPPFGMQCSQPSLRQINARLFLESRA
jgi:hypothetical protein